MSTKWNEIKSIRVMHFLDVYHKHECLWNPRLEAYKNKLLRDNAYRKMILELNAPNVTINDIKLKIKSIRTTYRKEMTILEKMKADGKTYVPKLFWFNKANSFLRNVSQSRETSLKYENMDDQALEDPSIDFEECNVEFLAEDLTETEENHQEDFSADNASTMTQNPKVETENNITSSNNCEIPSYPQQYQQGELITIRTQGVAMSEGIATKYKDHKAEDEYDLFCRSVAVQLRGVSDAYSRSVAKFKIQQILFEAETGHYKKSACITIPTAGVEGHL